MDRNINAGGKKKKKKLRTDNVNFDRFIEMLSIGVIC